jgi:hypothetical protein
MKSYSARADQPPAKAHSIPTAAVQPKLLVVLRERVVGTPLTVGLGLSAPIRHRRSTIRYLLHSWVGVRYGVDLD